MNFVKLLYEEILHNILIIVKTVFRFIMVFKLNHDLQVKNSLLFVYKNIKNTYIFLSKYSCKFPEEFKFSNNFIML